VFRRRDSHPRYERHRGRPVPRPTNLHTISTRSTHVLHGAGLTLTLIRQSDPGAICGVRRDGTPPFSVTFAGSPVDVVGGSMQEIMITLAAAIAARLD